MSTINTETDEHVDRLLRAASRRLRDNLQQPVPTLTPNLAPRRSGYRIGLVAAALLAVLAIAGLVAVTTRDHHVTLTASAVGPRWVVTDLPDGWRITNTVGPGGDPYVNPEIETIYGTADAPSGPLLEITSSANPLGDPALAGTKTAVYAQRETLLSTRPGGQRLMYVHTPNGWTRLTAVELDDATLIRLVSAVTLNANGDAAISPDRVPTGMHLIIADTRAAIAPTVTDGLSNDPGVGAQSNYDPPPDRPGAGMTMATAPSTPTELLWLRLNTTSLGGVQLDSGPGELVMGVQGENFFHSLYWQRDGIAFLLSSPALNDLQLVTAANSAQPADPSAWAQLGGDQAIPPGDTIPATAISNG